MPGEHYRVVSIRENHEYKDSAAAYLQEKWPDVPGIIYKDCLDNCLDSENPLPQWYLVLCSDEIVGCAGLVTNDFISRMDLYPWLCAVYIDECHRGKRLSGLLMEQAKNDTRRFGFQRMYLSTHLIGFYEKFGFRYLAQGYHPWDEESAIYYTDI